MLDETTKELVKTLNQAHRVPNLPALFKFCEQAATIIQDQDAELDKLKSAKPAPKARAAKKVED